MGTLTMMMMTTVVGVAAAQLQPGRTQRVARRACLRSPRRRAFQRPNAAATHSLVVHVLDMRLQRLLKHLSTLLGRFIALLGLYVEPILKESHADRLGYP